MAIGTRKLYPSKNHLIDPVLLREEALTKLTLFLRDRSDILVCRWRVVCPTYDAKQHQHLNMYTTLDLRYLGTLSLKGKKEEIRLEERLETNLMSR